MIEALIVLKLLRVRDATVYYAQLRKYRERAGKQRR